MSATPVGWRVLAVVAVLAAAASLLLFRPVRLGLDLRGGTQIVLEAGGGVPPDTDTVDRTVEILRRRVDALGVSEPTLQRSGDRRIIVELPGVTDPDDALAVIGRTAQLTFHPVLGAADPPAAGAADAAADDPVDPGAGELVLPDEDGSWLRLAPAAMTGEDLDGAQAAVDPGLGVSWHVEVDFRGQGAEDWAALTGEAACASPGDPGRRVAIVLDGEIITSPQVSPEVTCGQGIPGGRTVISGRFTPDEARDLALLIRGGALPVPVEVVQQSTVGPTLGAEAISSSVWAALIGALLTILFMIAAYRLLGVVSGIALAVYSMLSLAVLVGLGATLTLPGIAGFVLAVGMAVDANVLVFERAKEELVAGRNPRGAVTTGYRMAWTAILDSNVTTLLAAVLLIFLSSGAVRGFGVTLSVGVVVSMFSALVVARLMSDLLLRRPALAKDPGRLGLTAWSGLRAWLERRAPDIVGRSRTWFAVSGVLVVLALAGIGVRGLSFGLEFSGGKLVEYTTTAPVDVDALRTDLAAAGVPVGAVQSTGEGGVAVRTPPLEDEQAVALERAVAERGGGAEVVRDEFIGPTIGAELRRNAVIALGIAMAAQLAYLAVRFRWTYGAAAVVALAHDVVILLGVFAWLGKTLDGVFLAALLTVIGYSVNDSVVIFDRIRERRRAQPNRAVAAVTNEAVIQTLPRTVNTGMGAMLILVALLVLGGESLNDFALALLVGTVVGTASSMLTAAPLFVLLERRTAPR